MFDWSMDKSPKGPLLNDLNTNHPVKVVEEEEEESSSTELGRKTFEGEESSTTHCDLKLNCLLK